MQVGTCTDVSLVRSSCMDPFKWSNKIIPGISQPHHAGSHIINIRSTD